MSISPHPALCECWICRPDLALPSDDDEVLWEGTVPDWAECGVELEACWMGGEHILCRPPVTPGDTLRLVRVRRAADAPTVWIDG